MSEDYEFQNSEGRKITRRQIFYFGWKEGAEIEPVDEGYIVNDELYRHMKDGE